MRKQEERHIIDILFVIGLFCIFALSTIFLISIGADIYGKTVSNTEINFNDRTSFAYVTEKIRQADRSGAITASTLEGRSVLKLQTPLSLSAGQEILPVSDFSVSRIQDNLLQITIHTADGDDCSLSVSLKADPYVSPAENEEGGAANEQ